MGKHSVITKRPKPASLAHRPIKQTKYAVEGMHNILSSMTSVAYDMVAKHHAKYKRNMSTFVNSTYADLIITGEQFYSFDPHLKRNDDNELIIPNPNGKGKLTLVRFLKRKGGLRDRIVRFLGKQKANELVEVFAKIVRRGYRKECRRNDNHNKRCGGTFQF